MVSRWFALLLCNLSDYSHDVDRHELCHVFVVSILLTLNLQRQHIEFPLSIGLDDRGNYPQVWSS